MGETMGTMMSLFSGSGSFEYIAENLNIEPKYNAEVEPYPIMVTQTRFPNTKMLGDVSKIHGGEIEPVDIITFGFPCQDCSVAGFRQGIKHTDNGDDEITRSGLLFEAVRIIRQMLEATDGEYPKYLVAENVAGLLSVDGGEGFKLCMDLLQNLGFIIDVNMLDAQYMGVPQRRKRVFIACVNANVIVNDNTRLSESVTLQVLTEFLKLNAVELAKKIGVEDGATIIGFNNYEDGIKRRIDLFSLQDNERAKLMQSHLSKVKSAYSEESSDCDGQIDIFILTEKPKTIDIDTVWERTLKTSKRLMSDETWERSEVLSELNFCVTALENTLEMTIQLMKNLKETSPIDLNYYEWVLSFLTDMEMFKDAFFIETKGRLHEGENSNGGTQGLEWNHVLWNIERKLSANREQIERYFRGGCTEQILS